MNSLQQRVENEFWEMMIPWLEKLEDSPRAQRLVYFGYRFQEKFLNRRPIMFALMVSSLGLTIGLGIGSLLAILF